MLSIVNDQVVWTESMCFVTSVTVINSGRLNCEFANDQRGHWASSNCCYTQLWAILWELKTKSRSYVRTAWAFIRLDIASIPTPTSLHKMHNCYQVLLCFIHCMTLQKSHNHLLIYIKDVWRDAERQK